MKRWIILWWVLIVTSMGWAQFNLYLEHQISVPANEVSRLQISQDGRFLAYGDVNGNLFIWDISAKRQLHTIKAHRGAIQTILFDHKQQRIVSGGEDGIIHIWDLYSGQEEKELREFGSSVTDLSLSPDDRLLAASGNKKEIFLWEFPIGVLKGKLKGHDKDVTGIAFNVSGDQLLSVGQDRAMIVWDVNKLSMIRQTSIEARTIPESGIDIKSADFSFDRYFVGVGIQEYILAKGGRGMIFNYNLSFYDWKTGAEIETLTGNRKDIAFFAISPDKQYAITDNSTLQKNELSFWHIQKGIVEQNYPIEGAITALVISEDGRWLAVAYQDAQNRGESHVNIWQLSGIEGYERFATGETVRSQGNTGFGASIQITTPDTPLIQFGEKRKLAVMVFDSPGLEQDVARTTTYLLEGRLGNSPFVELIERNQIEKVLEELRYQQTGMTTSNAVEVGQHLNAEYILIGSINKLGSLLIITAKLVNVETAQIEGTREVQCSNATIETISDMVSVIAPTIAKY